MDISSSDQMQTRKVLDRWENEGGKIFVDSASGEFERRSEARSGRVKGQSEAKRNPQAVPRS